jgi:3-hydroxybutyryl-CoA dehydrogenase
MPGIAPSKNIGVIGAGTMGAGIAQLAASAGHHVLLFDAAEEASYAAKERLSSGLANLVSRGKMSQGESDETLSRIEITSSLDSLRPAALIVEAVVEDLEIKRALFGRLEDVTADDTILCTNTSSLSVTSIARDLRRPDRLVGMHFFNPATVMKLVEVVSGVATAPEVALQVFDTAKAWGKIAVHAKTTPGFIVNRVARPFYAEALRLCEEGVADPATLDALLTESAGFRMGPFELMDLIGHDVNYAVSLSVFNAYYQDPRFRPSNLQLELVNAGRLGRKSGHGFFGYEANATKPAPKTEAVVPTASVLEITPETEQLGENVRLIPSSGRTARSLSVSLRAPVIVFDLTTGARITRMGFTTSPDVPEDVVAQFVTSIAAQGIKATRLPDWPGLVVMRTLAMLINEGFEAALQNVGKDSDIDLAMRYGVNYPKGPFEWGREIGLKRVLATLDNIHEMTGDPRYRASLGLRMMAQSEA